MSDTDSDDPIGDLIANADPIPYADADPGDLVANFLGHVLAGKYSTAGEFVLPISIPASTLDPRDLMGAQGMMFYIELRKC